jgi:DNA-directed RNA polymerase subunit RPC12/RpoP
MSLSDPKFKKLNETFICAHCGYEVPPAQSTCRDHCPRCLWSQHVDVNPGDRAADCGGLLRPVGYDKHPKKGFMILYRCETCGSSRRNRFLESDRSNHFECDSFNALLALTPEPTDWG